MEYFNIDLLIELHPTALRCSIAPASRLSPYITAVLIIAVIVIVISELHTPLPHPLK
jgi:uncharacterized membrane protein